jgi:hypothetical protein
MCYARCMSRTITQRQLRNDSAVVLREVQAGPRRCTSPRIARQSLLGASPPGHAAFRGGDQAATGSGPRPVGLGPHPAKGSGVPSASFARGVALTAKARVPLSGHTCAGSVRNQSTTHADISLRQCAAPSGRWFYVASPGVRCASAPIKHPLSRLFCAAATKKANIQRHTPPCVIPGRRVINNLVIADALEHSYPGNRVRPIRNLNNIPALLIDQLSGCPGHLKPVLSLEHMHAPNREGKTFRVRFPCD